MSHVDDIKEEAFSTLSGKKEWMKRDFIIFLTEIFCKIANNNKIDNNKLSEMTGISLKRLLNIFRDEGKDLEIGEIINIIVSLGYCFKYDYDFMTMRIEKDSALKKK